MPASGAKREVAVATMVYDDGEFLPIWLDYWTRRLPADRLHVICDGPALAPLAQASGVRLHLRERPAPHPNMEVERWEMLSAFAADLLGEARTVVYTDVDEILVADPRVGGDVVALLDAAPGPVAYARGLEVVHRPSREPGDLDLAKPILRQRRWVRPTTHHSKPCIAKAPTRWGRGGHFCDQPGLRFAPGVYALHLRFFDRRLFLDRAARRRRDTEAEPGINDKRPRRWRRSAADAEAHFDALADGPTAWPVEPLFRPAEWRMRRSFRAKRNSEGLFMYRFWASRRLRRLPPRFLSAF